MVRWYDVSRSVPRLGSKHKNYKHRTHLKKEQKYIPKLAGAVTCFLALALSALIPVLSFMKGKPKGKASDAAPMGQTSEAKQELPVVKNEKHERVMFPPPSKVLDVVHNNILKQSLDSASPRPS
ncbi:MAG: hypothetical protein JWO00_664 [Candidatus Parcubacteria bacterium]|nr:hypothetical protein [Candidatus Parcubacteria bacterium]